MSNENNTVDIITENKKRFDELFELTKDIPKLTCEQLCDEFKRLTGNDAPDTTHGWLVEAVCRHKQNEYYDSLNVELPNIVVKANKEFFNAPVPNKNTEKKKAVRKSTSKRNNGIKNKILKWNTNEKDDDVISKQKKEHIKCMLLCIKQAGNDGISVPDLVSQVESSISNAGKPAWDKCSINTHVTWLIKKFNNVVSASDVTD